MESTKISEEGYWWLPESPEKKIPGKLEFNDQNGGTLLLMGSIREINSTSPHSNEKLIIGIGTNGTKYTLENCSQFSSTYLTSGISKISYNISVIYQNFSFTKPDDIVFYKMSIQFSNLKDWVMRDQFKITHVQEEGESPQSEEIKIIRPLKKTIAIGRDHLEIACSSASSIGVDSFTLKNRRRINIILYEPLSFANFFQKYIRHIQNYLSLALGKAVYPISIIASSKNAINEFPDGKKIPAPITIYAQYYSYPEDFPQIHPLRVLFLFSDIKNDFEQSFNLWISKVDLLEPIIDLYFGTLYNDKLYLQSKFLNLTQAMESYHRRRYGGTYTSPEENEKLSNILNGAIPPNIASDHKESIKGKFKYLHEFSQRKRFKDLIHILHSNYGDIFDKYLENSNQFVEDVVNTRNYNTHFDENLKGKAKDGFDLFVLTEKQKFLLEICFLSEIGFSKERVVTLLNKTQKYQFLLSYKEWNPR